MQIKRFAFEELWDFMEGAPPADFQKKAANEDAISATLIPTQPTESTAQTTQEEAENSISEEELKLAKQHAYEEGLAAGIKQATEQERAKAEAERIATETQIKQLIASFEHARSEHQHITHAIAQELKEFILVTSEHVAGSALHALPLESIEHTIEQCLPMFIEEPSVAITVHPSIAERFGTALHIIITELGYQGEYKLQTDTALNATDMRIAWEGGDATRDTEALWQEVRKMVHAMPLQQHLEQPELFDIPSEPTAPLDNADETLPEQTGQENEEMPAEVAVETEEESLPPNNENLMINSEETDMQDDMQRVIAEGEAIETDLEENLIEASLPTDEKEE